MNKTKSLLFPESNYLKVNNLRKRIDLALKETYRYIGEKESELQPEPRIEQVPHYLEDTFTTSNRCIIFEFDSIAIQSTSYGNMSCDHINPKLKKPSTLFRTPERVDLKTNLTKSKSQTITPLRTPPKSTAKTPIRYDIYKSKSKRNTRGNDQIDGISRRWKRQLLHLTFIFWKFTTNHRIKARESIISYLDCKNKYNTMRRLFLQWKINTKEHRLEFNKKSNLYYMQNQSEFKQRFNTKYDVLKKEYRNVLNELDKEKSEKERYHRLAEYIQLEVDALVKDKTINAIHLNKLKTNELVVTLVNAVDDNINRQKIDTLNDEITDYINTTFDFIKTALDELLNTDYYDPYQLLNPFELSQCLIWSENPKLEEKNEYKEPNSPSSTSTKTFDFNDIPSSTTTTSNSPSPTNSSSCSPSPTHNNRKTHTPIDTPRHSHKQSHSRCHTPRHLYPTPIPKSKRIKQLYFPKSLNMESYYTIINEEKVCISTNIANGILNDLTVDDILLRWFNLHLLRSGNAKPTMGLLGGSIYESLPNYAYLLCELRHKLSKRLIHALKQFQKDDVYKSELVSNILRISIKETDSDVIKMFRNETLINGEPYVHRIFVGELFSHFPSLLRIHRQELSLYEKYHKSLNEWQYLQSAKEQLEEAHRKLRFLATQLAVEPNNPLFKKEEKYWQEKRDNYYMRLNKMCAEILSIQRTYLTVKKYAIVGNDMMEELLMKVKSDSLKTLYTILTRKEESGFYKDVSTQTNDVDVSQLKIRKVA